MEGPRLHGLLLAAFVAAPLLFAPAAAVGAQGPEDGVQLLQASVNAAHGGDASTERPAALAGQWPRLWTSGRVLLFWAVGNSPLTKNLVAKNIAHARAAAPMLHFDVYLAHYQYDKLDWERELGAYWYSLNVRYSAEVEGLKFWLARDLLLRPQSNSISGSLSSAKLPRVDIHSYEFLWILDEDAGFFNTDLRKMLRLARASDASIMTPAFTTRDGHPLDLQRDQSRRLAMLAKASDVRDVANETAQGTLDDLVGCQNGDVECALQRPNPQCAFRHTNFVEVSFPLMRPQAFEKVLGECTECLFDRGSTWGLSRVWCNVAAEKLPQPQDRTCAVLDGAEIVHFNAKTHWKYSGHPRAFQANTRASWHTKKYLGRYAVAELQTFRCEVL